jgi:hypothetical protein
MSACLLPQHIMAKDPALFILRYTGVRKTVFCSSLGLKLDNHIKDLGVTEH